MPESLYALALLACPAGMGLMMWMMMRGKTTPSDTDAEAKRVELVGLKAQIDQLLAEQRDANGVDAPLRTTP